MNTVRVLHVDDDPSFRDLVPEFLEREDERLNVVSEASADDGLSHLEGAEHLDCIVSDYDMPGTNGLEFLDTVRNRNEKIPFILYTGKGSEAVAGEAISKGATDYLQKGGGSEQYELLANRIQNAVTQYRSQRRAEEHERVTQVVRDLNRALIRAGSTDEIETGVCEILSDAEPYLTACIAGVDTDAMQIAPRTWAGDAAGYFRELDMTVDEESPGRRAPGGRAFHEREIAVSQNISEDERYERWREAATERGFRSLAVVPLEYDGDLHGLLAVFADRPFAFDDTERDLLSELGEDIAHAMYTRELQTELRTTASRLEVLFERSPDMINVHDTAGNLLDPNPKLCEKTGYSAAELTEMKVWELDRTMEPDEAMALWEGMDVGDSRRLTGEYRRVDGTTFPVEVHIRRLDLAGNDQFMAISRDISGRRQRERELERYEQITENLPVGIFRTTYDGDIVSANTQFVSLYGGDSRADFGNIRAWDLWADSGDREELLGQLERDGVVEDLHVRAEALDGEQFWAETTIRLTAADGDRYIDGVVQDVTEQRDRTRRLEQAETLFQNTKDALFLVAVGEEFVVDRVNPAYETATGLPTDEVCDRTPIEIVGDGRGAEIERKYRECVDRVEPLEYEEELVIDGERSHWETRIAPVVVDGTVEKLVGATRNITRHKRREEELERQNERFDELASVVSHDLQTPLATARGRAELAVETGNTEHVVDALAALERADDLREGLVEMLRSREIVQTTETVDISAAAEEVWEAIRPPTDTSLRVLDPPRVRGDPAAVRRLLENLLSNAVEHGQQDVTVQLGGLADGFYIEDDGPGIPLVDFDDVFRPGCSTNPEGSGIGLASVREIVVAHDWTIEVTESRAGGARFEIRGVESAAE